MDSEVKRGRKPLYDYEALATQLWEELEKRPEGMLMDEIIDALGVPSRYVASKVITTLRIALGEGDVVAVPIVRDGQKHIYQLDGTLDGSRAWMQRRLRFVAQLAKTNTSTFKALGKEIDGRTKDGKALTRALTSAVRLEEDLEMFLAELQS